ncbi:MAG: dTMP kinase [Dehalococcoidia bacterium]|nr:dTMP kinase [Dehalococcoidia bacterium]MDZ4247140.1 dTMP kinase [Dehalococcoidia bacterium]
MSIFITFEGVEGCGKSTQAKALYRRLKRQNLPVLLTYEPGGTKLGARIRRLLKKATGIDMVSEAELFLFLSSRAQLVREVIRPNLDRGTMVVCDRYAGSTLAYQGYGLGLKLPEIVAANRLATAGLEPDLIILMDLNPETGLRRKSEGDDDRFEQRELDFHRRVRNGYLEMAAAEPSRWFVVDASMGKKEIEKAIWGKVSGLLK